MSEFVQIGNFQVAPTELLMLLKRSQMLPEVVRQLTIERAIADIECNEQEQLLALKQLYDRYNLTSEERLQQWLDYYYLTRSQLGEIATRQFKIERFKQQTWDSKVGSYFLKRKDKLDRVVYSLIRTKELGIAQEIYFRASDGEQDFAELARQYSQGAESQTGGTIGPVEIGIPHPKIAHLLVTQPLGKICHPVQIEEWYAIVRSEKIIPAQLDESMRQRLRDELFEIWLQEQIQQVSNVN
jgi:parvulin-like peptidyl-prolyl isomerase